MVDAIFDSRNWAAVPFHFWSVVFFVFGSMVGSFLNVVIHRLPHGQSIVSPPSHCPYCKYSIPWYLNIPLITWLYLRGKCKNCGAPISIRYFLVELLTGVLFLGCWLVHGPQSALLALVYCFFLAALVAASFIDYELMIIPDEISVGGMVAGFLCSLFVWQLHGRESLLGSVGQSLLGIMVGGGLIYAILRAGKLAFGRHRMSLPAETRIVFGETSIWLPDKEIPYEEVFSRASDVIVLQARTLELPDRCYRDVVVRLAPEKLQIGEEQFDPETVPHMEAVSAEMVLPREAMGLGDAKFMAMIGAFLGWHAVIFSLMLSSIIGSIVGVGLILIGKRQSRLPYGPFIAIAAAVWVYGATPLHEWWKSRFDMIWLLFRGQPPPM